jgi:peptidyl-prolyl cis-trans isomerase B (cyclophilin B)
MAIGRVVRLVLLTLAVLMAMSIAMVGVVEGSTRAAPSWEPCTAAAKPRTRPENLSRPPQTVTRRDHLAAVVTTNCGRFDIALDARRARRIVNSFVYLARTGFYDGLLLYRVVPHFVIEGGSPRNRAAGGPGYHVTEPPPPGFHYRLGTVGMARRAVEPYGRAGSIFFIVTGQERYIQDQYAILGQVSSGLATIERIAALATESERPSQPVMIYSIRIRRGS